MKTPYDPVVRLGTREVEALRDALRREMVRAASLADEAEALAQRVRAEVALVQGDTIIPTDRWVQARKTQAAQIATARAEVETGLAQLRDKAMLAYGKLRAAEKAASLYIEHAEVEAERKAQAEADDLSSARRLLKLRHEVRRRLPARLTVPSHVS